MNDPWDVKNVRKSEQYVSCLKLNGVPLLPPVLSKECRKEMEYYKLLALEVEKRIQTLKSYVLESDSESIEDQTDAPDLPESEQNDVSPLDTHDEKKDLDLDSSTPEPQSPVTEIESISKTPSKFTIDLSFSITDKSHSQNINLVDVPERDWECTKEKIANEESKPEILNIVEDKVVFSVNVNKNDLKDPLSIQLFEDESPLLSAKSFTGSLNNICTDNKGPPTIPLARQRSYTVLTPSPMLLAHLEIQSWNTGVEINSISMSESVSNLNSLTRKRRSWDLETAKVKWSSMAQELKDKNIDKGTKAQCVKTIKKTPQSNTSQKQTHSVGQEKTKRITNAYKPTNKSEPLQKPKRNPSPVRIIPNKTNNNKTPECNGVDTKQSPNGPLPESEDPATRVRELYEKIQKQQLIQMATLVEKQKKEQMLLQQVFEEQNNLLYTQLKTICPKPSNDIKEAWSDKTDQGPVSLSQLINHKPSEPSNSPVLSTLTNTNNYLNRCDSVLKQSRNISSSIKKNPEEKYNKRMEKHNGKKCQSPARKNSTSRKLTYDTSSDRDGELILTDRTNDTMADLNVTFPSDHSDECPPYTMHIQKVPSPVSMALTAPCKSTDRAIRSMEETIHKSIKTMPRRPQSVCRQATPQEREAATKIVAHVKGYLVRRLMRTERVQGTVQTIKDALLCALQLHQDRAEIRGADVDLHRRLIQQITAACYSLHDTFIASSPSERCALIAADRGRRRSLADRPPPRHHRSSDQMSQSHCGSFPARTKRHNSNASLMTQSNYETFRGDNNVRRYMPSPRRRPWR